MGSSLKPKSTRAVKTRSVPKPPPKPVKQKPSRTSAATDALLEARERRADAILKLAKAATPARPTADTSWKMREHVPMADALRQMRDKLDLVCSCAIVVEHALMEQNCELDGDAARVLKRCVGDELDRQIERINHLLGTHHRDNADEAGGAT